MKWPDRRAVRSPWWPPCGGSGGAGGPTRAPGRSFPPATTSTEEGVASRPWPRLRSPRSLEVSSRRSRRTSRRRAPSRRAPARRARCSTFRRRSRSAWPRGAPSATACRVEAHAEWQAPADRPDPVGVLEEQNATRVPDLVPIRHGRMIVSPFTFYRGGAAIMAWDLSRTPTTGLRVQCCGDAHLSNFGVFAAPDRRLVFDLNDFDETLPGAVRVGRQAARRELRRRRPRQRLTGRKEQRAAARAAARRVPDDDGAAREHALPGRLVRPHRHPGRHGPARARGPTRRRSRRPRRTSPRRAGARASARSQKFAEEVDGDLPDQGRCRRSSCTRPRTSRRRPSASSARGWPTTRRRSTPDRRLVLDHYHFVDFARKVVGVGSVGTEAFMILLMGDRDDDPLFLQVKEANTSVLAPFAGDERVRASGRARRAAASA